MTLQDLRDEKEPARWRSRGSISTKTTRDGHKLYAQGTSAELYRWKRIEMGSEAEVGVGSDVTYRARSLGFSLSVMESALVYWGGTTWYIFLKATDGEWGKNEARIPVRKRLQQWEILLFFALRLDTNQSYFFSTSSWREKDIPFLLPRAFTREKYPLYTQRYYIDKHIWRKWRTEEEKKNDLSTSK